MNNWPRPRDERGMKKKKNWPRAGEEAKAA
jgi:hypothetical protein